MSCNITSKLINFRVFDINKHRSLANEHYRSEYISGAIKSYNSRTYYIGVLFAFVLIKTPDVIPWNSLGNYSIRILNYTKILYAALSILILVYLIDSCISPVQKSGGILAIPETPEAKNKIYKEILKIELTDYFDGKTKSIVIDKYWNFCKTEINNAFIETETSKNLQYKKNYIQLLLARLDEKSTLNNFYNEIFQLISTFYNRIHDARSRDFNLKRISFN